MVERDIAHTTQPAMDASARDAKARELESALTRWYTHGGLAMRPIIQEADQPHDI